MHRSRPIASQNSHRLHKLALRKRPPFWHDNLLESDYLPGRLKSGQADNVAVERVLSVAYSEHIDH
jgi:hypothetical protein